MHQNIAMLEMARDEPDRKKKKSDIVHNYKTFIHNGRYN